MADKELEEWHAGYRSEEQTIEGWIFAKGISKTILMVKETLEHQRSSLRKEHTQQCPYTQGRMAAKTSFLRRHSTWCSPKYMDSVRGAERKT